MPAMTDPLILSVIAVVFILAFGSMAVDARRTMHAVREIELQEAINLLRLHCESLEALDDEATPLGLLEFALELNQTLHDLPSRPLAIAAAKRQRARNQKMPSEAEQQHADRIFEEYKALLKVRPDLATAFIRCLVSGVLSFEIRWPECAIMLDRHLSRIVASPVDEARRCIEVAQGRRKGFSTPVPFNAAVA